MKIQAIQNNTIFKGINSKSITTKVTNTNINEIKVYGIKIHNLKNINIDTPLNKIVTFWYL